MGARAEITYGIGYPATINDPALTEMMAPTRRRVAGAENVKIEHVRISGTSLDAIQARRSSVAIRDCLIHSPVGEYAQGIDISFGADLPMSLVEGCTIIGGREGIVTHFSNVHIRSNHVTGTTLRALGLTEMSMVMVEDNDVQDALGVGIYCGDYSECMIEDNVVGGTRPDIASEDRTRMGFGLVAHSGAKAEIEDNETAQDAGPTGTIPRQRAAIRGR